MKCQDCGQDERADTCSATFIKIGASRYGRVPYHSDDQTVRCLCGVRSGGYHHYGCEAERCPICGDILLGCDCGE